MFNLFRRWFGWDGRPINDPSIKGPITRSTLVIDLRTQTILYMNLTTRATIVIAPDRTTKVL